MCQRELEERKGLSTNGAQGERRDYTRGRKKNKRAGIKRLELEERMPEETGFTRRHRRAKKGTTFLATPKFTAPTAKEGGGGEKTAT